MRCDSVLMDPRREEFGFNPRTYMRCDISPTTDDNKTTGFNPRTYMRCDVVLLQCLMS